MRFIIDAQLPPALARLLAALGHEAEHVADKLMASASDREIWDLALSASAVIVTKDEDFAHRKVLQTGGLLSSGSGVRIRAGGNCLHGSRRCCRISSRLSSAARH